MADAAGHAEQALCGAHVEQQQGVERAPALRVRALHEAEHAQRLATVAGLHPERRAGSEPVALREGGPDENGRGIGEERGERRVGELSFAQVAAERRLGQRVDAQHAQRLAPEVRREDDPFHHRRARAHAVIDAELAVDLLGQARGAAAHLVGGAPRDGLGAADEAAPRRGVGEVDRDHDGHAERHAEHHQARVQRPAHEVAQARAQQGPFGITRTFRRRSSARGRRAPPPRGCA